MLQTRNKLIADLVDVHDRLRPKFVKVVIPAGKIVHRRGDEIGEVSLVEMGLAAITWPDGESGLDIALVGPEGMLGAGGLFGGPLVLFPIVARTELTLLQGPAQAFYDAVSASPELKARVFVFFSLVFQQIAEAAFVNARFSVEQRVARWIGLAVERLCVESIRITHDELAAAIGCRRAGVTVALHCLEGERLIRSRRGSVVVLDRRGLALFASGQVRKKPIGGAIGAVRE